jgi:hypothetical protein
MTDRVREPATERKQRGQRQQVGVDRPLHAGVRQNEFLLNLGRRDRHDRLIIERHRDGEDHRRQDQTSRSPARSAADRHAAHATVGVGVGSRSIVRVHR